MAKLILRDQEKERTYEITQDLITIGRVQENHIVIKDPRSSRKHCQIKKTDQGYKIIDLKSRNGILVNGKPVKEALLQHGDKIEIGDTILFFQDKAEKRSPSPKKDWFLKVSSGPDQGKEYILGKDPMLIGRHENADIRLTDPEVAIHHCQILPREKGFSIVDLNSQGGLYINGKKVKKTVLQENMVITIGKTNLRVLRSIVEKDTSSTQEIEEITIDDDSLSESTLDEILLTKEKTKEEKKLSGKSTRKKGLSPPNQDFPLLDDEEGPFPSQAEFEALKIQGIEEKTSPLAILSMVGGVVVFFLSLMVGYAFLSRILMPRSPDPRGIENLVSNWSFEKIKNQKPLKWTLKGKATLEKGISVGGKYSVRLDGSDEKPGRLISEKIVITPNKSYHFKFYFQNQGATPLLIRFHWINESRGKEKYDYPAIIEDNGKWREKGCYSIAPDWADTLEIEFLTLSSSGRLWIDRVALEERDLRDSDEEEPLVMDLDKDFLVAINSKGLLWVYQKGRKMGYLEEGRFQIDSFQYPSLQSQRAAKITKEADFSKGTIQLEGKIFLPSQKKWLTFIQRIHKDPKEVQCFFKFSQKVDFFYVWKKNSSVALRFPGKKESFFQNPPPYQTKEWSLGKKENKLVISTSQEATISINERKGTPLLMIKVPHCQSLAIVFKRTSKVEQDEIESLEKEAWRFENSLQYEKGSRVWQNLFQKYGYYPNIEKLAQHRIRYIKDLKKNLIEELESMEEQVDSFKSPFLVESGKKKIKSILFSFPSLEPKGKKILEKLVALEKKREKERRKEKAKILLAKANRLLGTGRITLKTHTLALALACYKEILFLKPDAPNIVEEAKNQIRAIEQRLKREILRLLKY